MFVSSYLYLLRFKFSGWTLIFSKALKKATIIMHPGDFIRHAINYVYSGLPPLHLLLLRIDWKARGIIS